MPATAVPPAAPSVSALPSRRDRKKSKTRSDLISAGIALFAERGFDETTTVDIAEAADVSQRTLFRHFVSKEALLYGDMEDTLVELRDGLAARPNDETVLEALTQALLGLADDFKQHREARLLQARLAARYPSVSQYSRATVQSSWEWEIIQAVAGRLDVDPAIAPRPEALAGAAMSAIRFAMRRWVAGGGEEDLIELVRETVGTLADLGTLR